MLAIYLLQSTSDLESIPSRRRNWILVLLCGGSVGLLGGLIGLGGAEFRLPLLISLFGFVALEAVILNKATSLVVVAVSLPFRAASVPFASIAERWDVLALLLPGTLAGAWLGAGLATSSAPSATAPARPAAPA